MKRAGYWRPLVLFAVGWALTALISRQVTPGLSALIPIWVPTGVAMAMFRMTSARHWPHVCAILGPTVFLTMLGTGSALFPTILFTFATLAESVIYASIAGWAMGGHSRAPETPKQVVGLFVAALSASLVGTVMVLPSGLLTDTNIALTHAFSHALSFLTVGPLILLSIRRSGLGAPIRKLDRPMELAWTLAFVAAISVLLLQTASHAVAPLFVIGVVLVIVRFGEPYPSLTALLFASIATIASIDGRSPLPNLETDPRRALLVVQTWMMLMIAATVPMMAMLMRRQEMADRLARQNVELEDSVTSFSLAEELAGIGRWHVELVRGRQTFSPVMLTLLGVPADPMPPANSDIRELIPSGGDEIFEQLDRHFRETEPFTFDCTVKPPIGPERILRLSARNEFGEDGRRKAVFVVAMEVTEQVRREEALDLARGRAVSLAAEAQKLANTDVLTGLPNRRCSLSLLDRLVVRAQRDDAGLAVLLFDIDHFKSVNDTFGHQVGDGVLERVADLARREMRGGDLVGRIGGEEFVCLIPGIEAEAARALAERLRVAIANESEGEGVPGVTVSVGIAVHRPGDSAEGLLARADEALYAAKAGGRNQVLRVA